jgi:hypothetical protein
MVTASAEGSAPAQARGRIPIIDCAVEYNKQGAEAKKN